MKKSFAGTELMGNFAVIMEIRDKKAITVYCASSPAIDEEYFEAARELGRRIALSGACLVTGAGNMGLMGAVNDAAIAAGGETVGVIPEFMVSRGWHHDGLSRLIVTKDMHERKSLMASLAHGVIALPGGIGTFEELCEIITWRQLGLYSGNIVIYNVRGYYDPLLNMLDHAISEGFMRPDHNSIYQVVNNAEEAVAAALAPVGHREFSAKF